MRQISRQEDYGIFLMSKLAENYGKGSLSLTTIANDSGLSVYFLKQLAIKLRKAELIKSKEGIGGGYILTKKPKDITLGMIVSAFSGPVELVECLGKASHKDCKLHGVCKTRSTLSSINKEIIRHLDSVTLASL
jgi:Rrf2 family transcriptional regulator, cysteine metabolism repressor